MYRSIAALIMIALASSLAVADSNIAYRKIRYGATVAHTVTANLAASGVKVTVALSRGGSGSSESFKSIVGRTRPNAAITGTFFDTRTLVPTGDLAMFGTVVHSGCIGSALCIDSDNRASIVSLRDGRECKWAPYETVMCAGPTLVKDAKTAIALKHEGFRGSLYASARRTAVGITGSGKLMLMAINREVSLFTLAKTMIHAGIVDGVCLDGGSSTGFYHQGAYYAVPSRQLTNCLVVYSSEEKYNQAKCDLAPARLFASAK